jgi:hypothetical protein
MGMASQSDKRKGEEMKQKILLTILLLLVPIAQAGVFKCKTPEGIIYSEKPCPTGSAAGSIQAIPSSGQQQDAGQQRTAYQQPTSQSGINNVNAVPLPAPDKQRGAYESFLSKPNPRAFVICKDGRVMSFVGKGGFVDKQLAALPEGCAPYAINDAVVWAGQ